MDARYYQIQPLLMQPFVCINSISMVIPHYLKMQFGSTSSCQDSTKLGNSKLSYHQCCSKRLEFVVITGKHNAVFQTDLHTVLTLNTESTEKIHISAEKQTLFHFIKPLYFT